MKEKERIRMLLHPERYTDEQLDQMLDETPIPVPDVEEEWQQLKARRHHRRHHHPILRWAATIITVAALSGITYAAIYHIMKANEVKEQTQTTASQEATSQEAESQEVTLGVAPAVERNDSARQDRQFNNVELQQIMQQLSSDYGVKVVYKNDATRRLRFYLKWEAADSLQDILNHINHFEKVNLTLSGETITIE